MNSDIKHTAPLPHGYSATFTWSHRAGASVEWAPAMPHIRRARQWRRFREAYEAARREFLAAVATSIGGNILSVDTDGSHEMIEPATRH